MVAMIHPNLLLVAPREKIEASALMVFWVAKSAHQQLNHIDCEECWRVVDSKLLKKACWQFEPRESGFECFQRSPCSINSVQLDHSPRRHIWAIKGKSLSSI
jgi:hypothetical protein